METISWQDFEVVELRVGTLVRVEPFPEARKPAYKVWADFGPELGIRKSSAQITALYQPEQLVGRQIIAVLNFPTKQIGPFQSEFLLTGFYQQDGRRGDGHSRASGGERRQAGLSSHLNRDKRGDPGVASLFCLSAASRYFNRLKISADTASDPVSRIKPLVQP